MPEHYNNQTDSSNRFKEFYQMYDAFSREQQAAILWLPENFELVDQMTRPARTHYLNQKFRIFFREKVWEERIFF